MGINKDVDPIWFEPNPVFSGRVRSGKVPYLLGPVGNPN